MTQDWSRRDTEWFDLSSSCNPKMKMNVRAFFGDFVPYNCTFKTLKHILTEESWDALRKWVFRTAFGMCEVCNDTGPAWPVQANAVWTFHEAEQTDQGVRDVQRLQRIEVLCPDCYDARHLDLALYRARTPERSEEVFALHLPRIQSVTDATEEDVRAAFDLALEVKNERESAFWDRLDLSWLCNYKGVTPLVIQADTLGSRVVETSPWVFDWPMDV